MKVLLTGAFGNVGRSTLDELLAGHHEVTILEVPSRRNGRLYKRYRARAGIVWGDIRDGGTVKTAVAGKDIVIHLAAIIPPLADQKPDLARSVNVEGTRTLVRAIEALERKPRLLFSSSVAVYGDRLSRPMIELTDALAPNSFDDYAKQKVEAEGIICESGTDWAIFRLTFIVPPARLRFDRMMFEMPLSTSIEVCDTKDVGRAFANAVGRNDLSGQTFHIAGGEKCRTSYGEYINTMMELFGIGRNKLPVEAFARRGYHCGFMNTDTSREKLAFQLHSLEDHFREVGKKMRFHRFLARLVRPVLIRLVANRSPYYKEWKRTRARLSVGCTGAGG
jgi:nucleoside-diphosphate-sugar epimerase